MKTGYVAAEIQKEVAAMGAEENKQLMQTLDDAWNSQDWDTFVARHAEDTAVYWPGQPEPTRGGHNHREESMEFFKENLFYDQIGLMRQIGLQE